MEEQVSKVPRLEIFFSVIEHMTTTEEEDGEWELAHLDEKGFWVRR
jgi:hypothetical protein